MNEDNTTWSTRRKRALQLVAKNEAGHEPGQTMTTAGRGPRGMGDDDAIAAMIAVPGVGTWTAEIYLLFALEREDVFPAGDLARAAAATHFKGLAARPRPGELREMARAWAPHRSLAARLLWHYWRFHTGRPSMDEDHRSTNEALVKAHNE